MTASRDGAAVVSGASMAGLAAALRVAEPLTDVVTHRFPSSLRRHWERCRRHPAGYVALGDAVCSFNPIYGQGMTSAVLQAEALGLELDRRGAGSDSLPRGFYRRAAKVVSAPWQIAAGADFAYPQTTGQKPPGTDAVNRYLARAIRATHVSPEVCIAMNEVQHLVASPPSLLRPALAARVLRTRSTPPLDPTLSRPGGELSRAAAR